jgi:transcriptional regulator with XRE-family HTH domain
MTMPTSFGAHVRWWRVHRGLSQLDLAGAAGTTQRHLSFLESGRTQPSREMVLRLATALDVPLRQQNTLLLAAGFAPVWRESSLMRPYWPWSTTRLSTCWPSRSRFPLSLLIDTEICCVPTPERHG